MCKWYVILGWEDPKDAREPYLVGPVPTKYVHLLVEEDETAWFRENTISQDDEAEARLMWPEEDGEE